MVPAVFKNELQINQSGFAHKPDFFSIKRILNIIEVNLKMSMNRARCKNHSFSLHKMRTRWSNSEGRDSRSRLGFKTQGTETLSLVSALL